VRLGEKGDTGTSVATGERGKERRERERERENDGRLHFAGYEALNITRCHDVRLDDVRVERCITFSASASLLLLLLPVLFWPFTQSAPVLRRSTSAANRRRLIRRRHAISVGVMKRVQWGLHCSCSGSSPPTSPIGGPHTMFDSATRCRFMFRPVGIVTLLPLL